jgi:hypothetical protein
LNSKYFLNRLSSRSNASVTLCQNEGVSGVLAGQPPGIAAP